MSLRDLHRTPRLRPALARSAVYSAAQLGGTLLAWITAAHIVAAALLQHATPTPRQLAAVAAGLLLRAAGLALRDHGAARLAAHTVREWRDAGTQAALQLGPVLLSDDRASDLERLTSDAASRLTPYYARYLPQAVHAAVAATAVLAAVTVLDPASAAVLAVTGPLTVVFLALVGLAAQAQTERQWLAHTRLSARLVTLVRALPTLHAFGQVGTYRDLLRASADAQRVTTLRVLKVAFLSGFVMDFAATLGTALAAVWIGVRLFEGHAALAPTLAALMLVPEFFGPLRQLGTDRHAALDAEPVAARLTALLARPLAPSGPVRTEGAAVPHLRLLGASPALHVGTPEAGHPDDRRGTPLTLDLPPGTHAALLGPSGSGKTTLLHALRKHLPHHGQILVDGEALDTLDSAGWQARVALVPQHPRLVSGSVRDNLRLLADADDAALWRALDAVDLGTVVRAMPAALDTPLGEGGQVLSGGETARLALARALLSGAPVVLLDEVTAHLDAHTEKGVHALLHRALAGRTVILATHRAVPPGFTAAHLTRPAHGPAGKSAVAPDTDPDVAA